jgi:hypothetical protein
VCGEVISTSGGNPNGWLFISEVEFDRLWDAGEGVGEIYQQTQNMYRCPRSGHLWVFWAGLGEPGTCYAPQPPVPTGDEPPDDPP